MNILEELKQQVADLFAAATDRQTIEKAARFNDKIDKAIEEKKQNDSDYQKLLKDYKDVVLHSSFKPNKTDSISQGAGSYDPNADFQKFFVDFKEEKK